MSLCKSLFLAVVCVSLYAHADESTVTLFRTHNPSPPLTNCALRVETRGGEISLILPGVSASPFVGENPAGRGDYKFKVPRFADTQSERVDIADELLIVHFDEVNSKLLPTRYLYENVRAMELNRLVQPYPCNGLLPDDE